MPRIRSSFILLLAIGSGLAALLLTMRLTTPGPRLAMDALAVHAVRDIKLGSLIKAEDIDLLPAPPGANPKVLFTDTDRVAGQTSRRYIPKGGAVRTVDLLSGEDNLASLIPSGYRAMNIPVSMPADLAKLLEVGNRVDILLTYQRERQELDTITLVKNAKVIGVSSPAKGLGGAGQEFYITLAVTPEGAESLAYAMKRGTLQVVVHSLLDEDEAEKFFTLKELFSKVPEVSTVVQPIPEEMQQIEVIRGVTKETYSLGAKREPNRDEDNL